MLEVRDKDFFSDICCMFFVEQRNNVMECLVDLSEMLDNIATVSPPSPPPLLNIFLLTQEQNYTPLNLKID